MTIAGRDDTGSTALGFVEIGPDAEAYEYGVLVTSLEEEVVSACPALPRPGGLRESFDELKNQWGWAGFVTSDLARCRTMARFIALILQLVEHLRASG